MIDVMRFTHALLPGGELFFGEEEQVLMKVTHYQTVIRQMSQVGAVSLTYCGPKHFIFEVEMDMYLRDTVERLDILRGIQAETVGEEPFMLYPYWLYDQASRYEVLWTNVSEFFEEHKHGRIEGCWKQVVIFEEAIAVACPATALS